MTEEEYKELKTGDRIWVSEVRLSKSGHLNIGILAEIEKTEAKYKFKVINVERGTSLKKGHTVCYYAYDSPQLFKTRGEAIENWNKVIYNEMDRLTSTYQQTIKRVESKLI